MIALLNHFVNPIVRTLLRSPAHRLLSRSVMLLTYTGRRTGRRRTIPVMYARDGDTLLVNVGAPERKRWWRNFESPAPVEVLVERTPSRGCAELLSGEQASAAMARYAARFDRASAADGSQLPVIVRVALD